MAEFITFLVALPALYGIGLFYARLGGGVWQAVRQAKPAASSSAVAELPQDSRYETALATARVILQQFATQPDLQGHERLASITYAVLEAIYRIEQLQQAGTACPEPSVN